MDNYNSEKPDFATPITQADLKRRLAVVPSKRDLLRKEQVK